MFLNEEVKYKVSDMFADLEEGTIINAILLMRCGNLGLMYHPYTKGECPSIEIVEFDIDEQVWVTGEDNYINIEDKPLIFQKLLMGKDFSFKRRKFESSEEGAL